MFIVVAKPVSIANDGRFRSSLRGWGDERGWWPTYKGYVIRLESELWKRSVELKNWATAVYIHAWMIEFILFIWCPVANLLFRELRVLVSLGLLLGVRTGEGMFLFFLFLSRMHLKVVVSINCNYHAALLCAICLANSHSATSRKIMTCSPLFLHHFICISVLMANGWVCGISTH